MPRQAFLGRSLRAAFGAACLAGWCLAMGLGGFAIEEAQAQAGCAVRDWRCLLALAAADVRRDTAEDGDMHGRYLIEIAQAYPKAQRAGIAEGFLAVAGNDDDLKARIKTFLVPERQHSAPDVGLLRKALATGTSPEPEFAFPEYARMSFVGLIEGNDKDTILKLWREGGARLWRNAPQAELVIDAWLAETAPDLLKESIETRGLVDGGWAAVSAVAQRQCRNGDKQKGNGLLALLEQERRDWHTNGSNEATDLASSVTAVAACEAFEAADTRLDLAIERMTSAIGAIRTHTIDKEDAQASIELLRQSVAETGTRPLLRAYLDADRVDDAQRIFARLPVSEASTDVTLGADGSQANSDAQSDEDGWAGEYAAWAKARSYSDNPDLVLADVSRWEKEDSDNMGVDAMARMQRTADALLDSHGPTRRYVVRLKALGDRIAALPDKEGLPREQTQVILAGTEIELAGCLPSDEQLLGWEKAFANTRDLETQVDGRVALARLLRLMDDGNATAKRDTSYGECVVAGK